VGAGAVLAHAAADAGESGHSANLG
jgi:hypothetical protein